MILGWMLWLGLGSTISPDLGQSDFANAIVCEETAQTFGDSDEESEKLDPVKVIHINGNIGALANKDKLGSLAHIRPLRIQTLFSEKLERGPPVA